MKIPRSYDIDWEEYRDQFITEVREIAASKRLARSHDLKSVSIMDNDIVHIRRQPVPKFEIKIEGSNGAYSNLRLSIKNVSNVFVSGLKGISFYFLNKLGEPYTDVNNRPMHIPEKFEFKETSIASGSQTTVNIDTPELYKQNVTINPATGEKMRVSIVPHDVNVEFIFLCEDEYGEEYRFKAEATIPSASKIYSGVWKCKKID